MGLPPNGGRGFVEWVRGFLAAMAKDGSQWVRQGRVGPVMTLIQPRPGLSGPLEVELKPDDDGKEVSSQARPRSTTY